MTQSESNRQQDEVAAPGESIAATGDTDQEPTPAFDPAEHPEVDITLSTLSPSAPMNKDDEVETEDSNNDDPRRSQP